MGLLLGYLVHSEKQRLRVVARWGTASPMDGERGAERGVAERSPGMGSHLSCSPRCHQSWQWEGRDPRAAPRPHAAPRVTLVPRRGTRSPSQPRGPMVPPRPLSPLLAPVTMTVLPVRSVGHLRGSQARLLVAQSSIPSSKASTDHSGWLQKLGSSMAAAGGQLSAQERPGGRVQHWPGPTAVHHAAPSRFPGSSARQLLEHRAGMGGSNLAPGRRAETGSGVGEQAGAG